MQIHFLQSTNLADGSRAPLIGINPVDGMDKGKQTPPPVLTYIPNSFDLDMAVLVIGSGLGEVKKNPLFVPYAPKGINHEDFYKECREPACYFGAKDYSHVDMLDDETKGIRGKTSYCLCKNGQSREPTSRENLLNLELGDGNLASLSMKLDGKKLDTY
ncbi:hypothetical protein ACSBR1_026341 [Camellia fascicularis]